MGMSGVNEMLINMMPGTKWSASNPVAFANDEEEEAPEELSESDDEG